MDVGAFTELVRRHQAAVAAVAYAIVRDREIAHDLAQEAFVTAWRKSDELREPERVAAWLCGIVRFLARDHRRVERRRRSLRERHVESAPAAPPTPTPLDRVIAGEDDQLLAAVVGDLPESYREPLLLHYVAGCSVAEIAATLSINEDAVKQRLSRGRAALRDEPRFAAAALGLAPTPSFTDATVHAATHPPPPVPTKESFMSSHPILTASLLAGTLAAGGLAVAASRGGDDARSTSSAHDAASTSVARTSAAPAAHVGGTNRTMSRDRLALLQAIRTARARATSVTAAGAAPPYTASKVYDFSGETLTAGVTPKAPEPADAPAILTKSSIRAGLAGARAEVLGCYHSALARTPDLAGTLTVRVVVEGEPDIGGMISEAGILADASTIQDPQLESCVVDAISAIELPAPEEGVLVTVHYPYTFAPH